VVVLETCIEIFCYIFQQTHIWNIAALKTEALQQLRHCMT
jgi:hypothetical protein